MTTATRDQPLAATRTRRPAVVEHVDFPQSASDGRTINNRAILSQAR